MHTFTVTTDPNVIFSLSKYLKLTVAVSRLVPRSIHTLYAESISSLVRGLAKLCVSKQCFIRKDEQKEGELGGHSLGQLLHVAEEQQLRGAGAECLKQGESGS